MKRTGGLALLAIALAACQSGAPGPRAAGATATPVVIVATTAPTATPAPTLVDVYAGKVIFGLKATNDLKVPNPKSTFDRKAKQIAWVAHLTEPAGAPRLDWMVLRVKGGSETILFTEKVDVSPDWTLSSSHSAIPKFVDYKAGKYVMRYVRGGKVLAEGTFTLK